VKAVSRVLSEWAATHFFFTVYKFTGAVWVDESIRKLWKQFRGLFLSGQRLSFPWLFMTTQGLCGLTNPFVTCVSSFRVFFLVGSDSVFLDYLWVNRGWVGWRIYSSPEKALSGPISQWAATLFSLTVYEVTGAVWADEFIRHVGKEFRGLFLSSHRLNFAWLFMSTQGLCGLLRCRGRTN
jgi:hypothetical protein